MGEDNSLQFSEGEEEIAGIFWDIGLKKNTARVLVLMFRDVDLTSREMERICDLRQPEVSIALTDLEKRKWVKNVRQSMEGKGRPVKYYHIIITVDEILDELKKIIIGDYETKIQGIEKIRIALKERVVEKV